MAQRRIKNLLYITLSGVVGIFIYRKILQEFIFRKEDLSSSFLQHSATSNDGLFSESIIQYNRQIEKTRRELLSTLWRFNNRSVRCKNSHLQIADADAKGYLHQLQQFTDIKTVFLEDSIHNITKFLRPTYYDYVSNDCQMLEEKSKGGQLLGRTRYGAECKQSFNEIWQGHWLSETALRWNLPRRDTNLTGNKELLTFIHVAANAVSFANGDVIRGNVKIVPLKCKRKFFKSCPKVEGLRRYREVFTISQFWGAGFFHSTLEDLPRIAPYLPFLNKHKHILIHVAAKVDFLNLLGIDKSRLITASAVHADLLYMPAGGPCGSPTLFSTQLLAGIMAKNFRKASDAKRDRIVLIKRSHKRWFGNHASILAMLRQHAHRRNLTVQVFNDNPLPSVKVTVEMFRRALVVVAPHGAGESNMIFSQPGTLLIEGLCYDSDKKTNLCYRNMAQALGLRYYGLIYDHQCMKITSRDIEGPLLQYLKLTAT